MHPSPELDRTSHALPEMMRAATFAQLKLLSATTCMQVHFVGKRRLNGLKGRGLPLYEGVVLSNSAENTVLHLLRGHVFRRKCSGDMDYVLIGAVPRFDEEV